MDNSRSSISSSPESKATDILLLQSVYKNRPPTIFFQYPKGCFIVRNTCRAFKLQEEDASRLELTFKIPGDSPYRCVMAAFQKAGFERTKGSFFILRRQLVLLLGKPNCRKLKTNVKTSKKQSFSWLLECRQKSNLFSKRINSGYI